MFAKDYMDYLIPMTQQIIDGMQFTPECVPNILAFLLCNTLGYLLYTRSNKMISREGQDPYPLWLHCWMITIDCLGTVTFIKLMLEYDFFWVFTLYSIGLPIWMVMEARSILFAVKNARQAELGETVKGEVTVGYAWKYVISAVVCSFGLNLWVLSCLGGFENCAIFVVWPFTNFVFAYWTWRFWAKNATSGTRAFNSMSLQIIITIQITVQWMPGLSWWWGISPFFHQWCYIAVGLTCSLLAAYNLYKCAKLPNKAPLPSGKKPVW